MCGCDYLENVKGIGLLKLLKLFQGASDLPQAITGFYTKQLGSVVAAQNYLKKVEFAMASFMYQLVYRPARDGGMVLSNLTAVPSSALQLKGKVQEKFMGATFPNAEAHSAGKTIRKDARIIRPPTNTDFDKMVRFFEFVPKTSSGFLNNLTTKVITFENFEDFLDSNSAVSETKDSTSPPRRKLIQKASKKFKV